MIRETTWYGLAHVKPVDSNDDIFDGAIGAYVNVVAVAFGTADLVVQLKIAMGQLGLEVAEVDDISRIQDLEEKINVDGEIWCLAEKAESTGKLQYGKFYSYSVDEEAN